MMGQADEPPAFGTPCLDRSGGDRLVLDAEHEALRCLRPWLDEMLGDLDELVVGRIELAVHELAANIIDHAETPDQRMEIDLERRLAWVTLRLSDRGRPPVFDDRQKAHPRVRGYGMMIVEQLSTSFGHVRTDDCNIWTLAFSTGGDRNAGSCS